MIHKRPALMESSLQISLMKAIRDNFKLDILISYQLMVVLFYIKAE